MLVGSLLNAYLAYRYFFALPATFAGLIALLLAASVWSARSRDSKNIPAANDAPTVEQDP